MRKDFKFNYCVMGDTEVEYAIRCKSFYEARQIKTLLNYSDCFKAENGYSNINYIFTDFEYYLDSIKEWVDPSGLAGFVDNDFDYLKTTAPAEYEKAVSLAISFEEAKNAYENGEDLPETDFGNEYRIHYSYGCYEVYIPCFSFYEAVLYYTLLTATDHIQYYKYLSNTRFASFTLEKRNNENVWEDLGFTEHYDNGEKNIQEMIAMLHGQEREMIKRTYNKLAKMAA